MPRRRSSAVIDEALWPLFGNCASRRSSCRASSHPVVHPTKTASCDRLRARRNYHGRFDRAALNGPTHRPTDAYLLRDLAPLTPSRNYSCECIHIYIYIFAMSWRPSFLKYWRMSSVVTQKLYVCRIILNPWITLCYVKHNDGQLSSRCQTFFARYDIAPFLARYSWWQKIWKLFL